MRINSVKAEKCLEECLTQRKSPVSINSDDDDNV